jgi:hypothetical protein
VSVVQFLDADSTIRFANAAARDRYIGERVTGPIFLGAPGGRMDVTPPTGQCNGYSGRAGITKRLTPQLAAQLDHRRTGRRRPAPRRTGRGQSRRPPFDDAL